MDVGALEDYTSFGHLVIPRKDVLPELGGSSSRPKLVKQFPARRADLNRKRTVMFTIPADTRVPSGPVGVASYLHYLVTKDDQAKMNKVEVPNLFNEVQQALNRASVLHHESFHRSRMKVGHTEFDLKKHVHEGEFYTKNGFRAWNKGFERLRLYVGDVNSVHDKYLKNYIINACAKETLKVIIGDLNGDYFGILVDESKHISHKEQVALVFRYVDKNCEVVERFVGLVHVSDTSASSLKEAIYSLLLEHSLSPSKIRGQGYDGASNMRGEINGLKTLIMKDSPSAYYIHCFAHQLQLILVAIAKKYLDVEDFFCHVTYMLNVIGGSFKRRDSLRLLQAEKLEQLLESGEVHTGQGLNQEWGLQGLDDNRWGSHFKTLDNFIVLFLSIVRVLEVIKYEGSTSNDRNQAKYLLSEIKTFKFIFMLHLMLKVLALSNELSKTLQKRDQDIINVVEFLNITKKRLQDMRESECESLLECASSFCVMHDILIPKMNEFYFLEKLKRNSSSICYSHHLRVQIFCAVIDVQLQELNDRFDVVSSNLILGMARLNPVNSFANYDKGRIMTLAKCYPNEFDEVQIRDLSYQLDTFIIHMRCVDSDFTCCYRNCGESIFIYEANKE
ncbi:uncharacterized protein LOC142178147 [Nicotiana tabacum]|uniref:Uncharacterized protein LOC142178147 n=1 Tax=Nicotiana tabacum TaxID=4097 RepID=A0AC58U268_TOBAC